MNQKQKELVKIFVFLFIVTFIIINWNDVSWIFNYQEVEGLVYDFFNPYQNSNLLVSASDIVINGNNNGSSIVDASYANSNNSLSIPSIGVNTAVVIGQSTDKNILEEDLDQGAVYYPGSVLPGQNGEIVILGHSAPPNWPHIKHDYIFSNIENLNPGDQIILNFNNTQYTYTVTGKKVIQQGQDIDSPAAVNNNILMVVSCWPPGKNYQRMAITAELMKS